ncbi:fic family toxin-antitoxin system, toxin component [Streptomyces sp. SID13666]|uniref:fic family toxin-antitoxin system, toxin component n=1 Tax=unclassified Streptomyces TaxID=2593676 RepID=UPI0013C15974|nr:MULTISPECIES: fic family toxin-antitoxin system, toxin component [unclassified Streptomyces]NEA53485.1 fic family toxin-antitoxin system, toxin component [Streptomyces sp. SID13666]NEA69191.1 fic family toxin-antitoxin system, toxin component [Streptomyces sp. SID13588]
MLDLAQTHLPGDPDVTDFGALGAAIARHRYETMGTPIYPEPHHRAAALLHSLVRVPALEHSNLLYAASVAVAYLTASGHPVKVTATEAGDLVDQVDSGQLDVRQIAAILRGWTQA